MPTKRPTQLKLISGTLRPDRQPVREPLPVGQLGDAPEYFTGAQRDVWVELRDGAPPGLLTNLDRGIFEGYVLLRAARDSCAKTWCAGGANPVIRSKDHGRIMPNPYLKEIRRLTEQMRLLENEMGFTPAARGRIDLGEQPPGTTLSKYLA